MTDPMLMMIWIQILLAGCCSNAMAGYILVMDEQFDSLDMNRWNYEITASGGGNGEFEMYTPDPVNTFLKDGKLFIKPTLTADTFGEAWLTNGTLDIRELYGRCTQEWNDGCLRHGKYGILNPVMSGSLKTRDFIQYGKIEVMAKLPRGDWMWPAIWMSPVIEEYGDWPASGGIDIAEARGRLMRMLCTDRVDEHRRTGFVIQWQQQLPVKLGNRDLGSIGIELVMSSLQWGPDGQQNKVDMTRSNFTSPIGTWADGMHNYTMEWYSTGISIYVDDDLVLNAPTPPGGYWTKGGFSGDNIWSSGHQDAPFDKPFYLILNVAVGGTNGFFPDDVANEGYPKPWSNIDTSAGATRDFWAAKHLWYPSWLGDDAAMQVESVRMWQLTGGNSSAETTIVRSTEGNTTNIPSEAVWPILVGCLLGLVAVIGIMLIIFILLWRRQTLWMMKMKYNLQLSEQNDGRRYDAFISYCGRNDDFSQSQDERFVIYKLRAKLEHELGYSLCIHQRDFIPGEAIVDNILSAVDNSRRTILILSQKYIRSEWCKAEYKAAYTELLKRQHRIIPIMLEKPADIPIDDPVLGNILRNITYIKYPREESEKKLEHFWKKVQYSMPKIESLSHPGLTFQLSVISVE